MKNFIAECVDEILSKNQSLENIAIVIPGNRPKQFFRTEILNRDYQGILPEFYSIEELFSKAADLVTIKGVPLWFECYKVYKTITDEPEPFEEFIKWLPTLLKDFDDIENELSEADALFKALTSDERLKQWSQNMDIGQNKIMQNYLGFWGMAHKFFKALKIHLKNKNLGFRGMISHEAFNNKENFFQGKAQYYYFCGFNALTHSEKTFINYLIENNKAEYLWDADEYYLKDTIQEAGFFLRQAKKDDDNFKFINHHFSEPKTLEIINTTDNVSQAKLVGQMLSYYTTEEVKNTALVLADEQLLPAILNSIPQQIKNVNITMGVALQNLPMAHFFRSVMELHRNFEKFNGSFYYKDLLSVIKQNSFSCYYKDEIPRINQKIQEQNKVFFKPEELKFKEGSEIFKAFKNPIDLIYALQKFVEKAKSIEDLSAFEKECLYHFESIFIQLASLLSHEEWVSNFRVLFMLYQQIINTESLNFIGEPQQGLQILGMLETRLLDFENIIMTSVNEGVLPLGRQENTFIPFEFRKRIKLNTFLENDAIYAYHFYHSIQRCKKATFLYNSNTQSLGKGEKSRFLSQLELESPHSIKHKIIAPGDFKNPEIFKGFKKTPYILERIKNWETRISPSSLTTYVKNPIDFYQRYILGISDADEIEEYAGFITLGNIVHACLEELYTPFLDEILSKNTFKKIQTQKQKTIDRKFDEMLLFGNPLKGKNIIIKTVIEEMINNVLRKDEAMALNNELIFKAFEKKLTTDYTRNNLNVNFKGYIDRIDCLNGVSRVIDYKTGSFNPSSVRLDEKKLTELHEKPTYDKSIQLIVYAYMFLKNDLGKEVMSGIYPLKFLNQNLSFLSLDKQEIFQLETIENLMDQISNIIQEIENPDINFEEKI